LIENIGVDRTLYSFLLCFIFNSYSGALSQKYILFH